MMSENEETQKGELFLRLALEANRQVRENHERLDAKVNNIIAADAAAITVLLGISYFVLEKNAFPSGQLRLAQLTVLFVGIALFSFSMIIGVYTYLPKSFRFVRPMDLIRELHHVGKTYGFVVRKTAGTISDAVDYNLDVLNRKANLLKYMFAFTVVGFCFVAIAFVPFLWYISQQ